MARILLQPVALISREFISGVQQMIALREQYLRLKDIMDEITNGGVNKNLLESSIEVIGNSGPVLTAGQGAILYDAIVTILAGINSASARAIVKQFDQG